MTKQEATDRAIERIKGRDLPIGTIVAVKHHPLSMELKRYEGDMAICDDGNSEKEYPKSEIFSIRQCINVANHLLNVGYWEEGMESIVVSY